MSEANLLRNKAVEELLREKANYFLCKKKIKDFWILPSIEFLNHIEILSEKKKTDFYFNMDKSNLWTLISLNKNFIKRFELRLGSFENLDKNFTKYNLKFFNLKSIIGNFSFNNKNRNNQFSPLYYNKTLMLSQTNFIRKYEKLIRILYRTKKKHQIAHKLVKMIIKLLYLIGV